ncbi:hypothetical protein G7Y89_g3524 [Cudoniella acicularis]|uniref:DDE-1 domain-containing protein n=1 Tax=Cudoniella acicularis TaxID=354080 RepID=A0A8H4RR70_9HELO|nr:hypothetical protein G7Y89_g3524 [Cudoniella acicularis]
MDETGVMLYMLNSVKVLISKDDRRDYRGAGVKRTTVTAVECISANVLISDGFSTHETLEVLEFCFKNNITLCRLPSHTTHKLQPYDVGVFAPLKEAYRDEVDRLFRGGTNTIGKEHFTSVYSPTRERAFTKRNITSVWAACGLFLFNPDRVLRKTPKPPPLSTVSMVDDIEVGVCQQDEVPQTPMTPITAEAIMSLYDLIKQDSYTLDETSIPRMQRHIQKLANAGQTSIAYCALLDERNSFLTSMNNEAKNRRSAKSVVLGKGKGKVMSYEDIEEARAKRAEKDAMKGKGKRGRKRKSAALEADEPDAVTEPEVAHAAKEVITGKRKRGRKRKSAVQETDEPQPEPEPEAVQTIVASAPWRAPVAHMY